MSMLMRWQWFLICKEAVLRNPNSPGTDRMLSQVLTAVMLQHCFFNNFLTHTLLILSFSHFLNSIPSSHLYPV